MSRLRPALATLLLALAGLPALAAPAGLDPALADGLAAYQQQLPAEAARRWERVATTAGDGPRRATAALAWVLVARARDAAGDSDGAWSAWGRANALHARAATDWPRERVALNEALRAIRLRLGAGAADAAEGAAGGGLSAGDALLLALEAATRIGRYEGPGLGGPAAEPEPAATPDPAALALAAPVRLLPLRAAAGATLPARPAAAASAPAVKPAPSGVGATTRPSPASATAEADTGARASPRAAIASAAAAATVAARDDEAGGTADSGAVPALALTAEPDRRDELDRRAAAAAWRYLDAQLDEASGICLPRPDDRRVTPWHLGDCLIGLAAASELALADGPALDRRLARLLDTLAAVPLRDDGLLPAVLDAATLTPLAADGPAAADELARLLTGLALVGQLRPALAETADALADRALPARLPRQRVAVGGLREAVVALAVRVPAARPLVAAIDAPAAGSAETCNTGEPLLLSALETGTADGEPLAAALARLRAASETRGGRLAIPGEATLPAPQGTVWLAPPESGGALRSCAGSGAGPRDPELAAGAAWGWATLAGDDWGQRLRETVLALDEPRLGLRSGVAAGGRPLDSVDLHTQVLVLEAVLLRARGGVPLLVRPGPP